jgi:HAE1 family hydrophobic/amphiphilic exporter-1
MRSPSPALAGLLLRRKQESHGLLRRFFDSFNRVFERATGGYVRWSGVLVRKGTVVLGLLVVCGVAGIFFGSRVPSSFLPDEDQGYLYINMQLPNCRLTGTHQRCGETGGENSREHAGH